MKNNHYICRRMFFQVLWPSLISAAALSAANMADAVALGNRMGESGLAAIGIVTPLYMIYNVVGLAISTGGGVTHSGLTAEGKEEEALAHDLFLLTNKPVMYICNVDDASAASGNKYVDAVREAVREENAEILVIAARTEAEIAEIESYEDRLMFLEELGLEESGVVRLIQGAYKLLGLQTFFTAGADECRAWTIRKGDKAPKAAGVIHSDFEKGFIRAEVIKFQDYMEYKTEAAVRSAGRLATEGKEYVVQDGDIMHFLFNV